MDYKFEKGKLYDYLGKELVRDLIKAKAYIAGGTITSLFCNREINDLDIYFRNEHSMIEFLEGIWDENDSWVVALTKKSILLVKDQQQIQLVHDRTYETAEEIFKAFDFTVCMGCFDFATESFVLHEDFMKHNSQRQLRFNHQTLYPIVSSLRINKYKEKGYSIAKSEFLKVMLSCMKLNIDSYEELKKHLGGMYGINLDKIFDETKEFSLEDAIIQLCDLHFNEDYYVKPIHTEFKNLEDIIARISKELNYIVLNDDIYRINADGTLRELEEKPENGTEVDKNEYFAGRKFYKFVQKKDDKYYSFYDENFEYMIGAEIKPKNDYLYFGFLEEVSQFPYKNREGRVLLEAVSLPSSVKGYDGTAFLLNKCEIVREVSIEEYKQFL
ncbi:hypothetical protein [Brevibacillus brevis]|uniref:hypothetical protein n=1 Tax=Brevibacillus brevis TaxID=1393 RepID=UPI0007D8BF84|nr:hypothetical protein [Brevibacillus brevis]